MKLSMREKVNEQKLVRNKLIINDSWQRLSEAYNSQIYI